MNKKVSIKGNKDSGYSFTSPSGKVYSGLTKESAQTLVKKLSEGRTIAQPNAVSGSDRFLFKCIKTLTKKFNKHKIYYDAQTSGFMLWLVKFDKDDVERYIELRVVINKVKKEIELTNFDRTSSYFLCEYDDIDELITFVLSKYRSRRATGKIYLRGQE